MSNLKWLKSTLKGATQLVKCEESRARLFDMGISEVTVTFVLSFPTVTRSPRTPEYIKNHFSALHAVPELSSHVTHQWHTTTCCSSPFFDCYVHSNVTVKGEGAQDVPVLLSTLILSVRNFSNSPIFMILSSTGLEQSMTKVVDFFLPLRGAAAGFFPTAIAACMEQAS